MNHNATYKAILKRIDELDNGNTITIGKYFYWLEYHNNALMIMQKLANIQTEYEYRFCLRNELERLAK